MIGPESMSAERTKHSPGTEAFCGIVGRHRSIQELAGAIEGLSRLRTTVLITGESGTGKELVARAIHLRGDSPGEPFVGINCGAFTRSLLEDQLFGHVRGAFTGAAGAKDGVFVSAAKGTLFLDEITEMDLDLQGRLLRAVQEREVIPLGTNRPVAWEARLVVATNRDLAGLVEAGSFRKDLYYRINVVQVHTPPLRERIEDLPLLVDHFLESLHREHGLSKRISPEALELLLRYSYPGNVRELRNAIERAYALGLSDRIGPQDLPPQFHAPRAGGF